MHYAPENVLLPLSTLQPIPNTLKKILFLYLDWIFFDLTIYLSPSHNMFLSLSLCLSSVSSLSLYYSGNLKVVL